MPDLLEIIEAEVREEVAKKVKEEVTKKVKEEVREEVMVDLAREILKQGLDPTRFSAAPGFPKEQIAKLVEEAKRDKPDKPEGA
jgi:hypothetical protein